MRERIEYEGPWAEVRGVFFECGIAEATSVTGDIKQNGWNDAGEFDPAAGDDDGALWLGF
jgi:hypothetical protein